MRPILVLIRKEFQQILKDRPMLMILFVMPIVQLFLLGYAVTTDVKHLRIGFLDDDNSALSRQMISSIEHCGYFDVIGFASSRGQLESWIQMGDADVGLVIPTDCAAGLETGLGASVQILVDGQNSNVSSIGLGYAVGILQDISSDLLIFKQFIRTKSSSLRILEARTSVFYNPDLKSVYYMIPGVVTVLLTVTTMLLTGMGVVREKEIGTLEQLLVTPILPIQLVIGKLVPFAILGFLELSLALTVGMVWFRIPFEGSLLWVVLGTLLFLLNTLGIGLFISTITSTQQQALFIAWFFMIFGMIMSGFFYPIENMPLWAQHITLINPLRYYLAILREVLLKGSDLIQLAPEFLSLTVIGWAILALTVFRFKSRLS
ncbi:MAG: ABC transporter permease [bacterium]